MKVIFKPPRCKEERTMNYRQRMRDLGLIELDRDLLNLSRTQMDKKNLLMKYGYGKEVKECTPEDFIEFLTMIDSEWGVNEAGRFLELMHDYGGVILEAKELTEKLMKEYKLDGKNIFFSAWYHNMKDEDGESYFKYLLLGEEEENNLLLNDILGLYKSGLLEHVEMSVDENESFSLL